MQSTLGSPVQPHQILRVVQLQMEPSCTLPSSSVIPVALRTDSEQSSLVFLPCDTRKTSFFFQHLTHSKYK
jgi:hypothetical protein